MEPIKHEPIVHEVPIKIEDSKEGIETTSITKQSSLDFFKSKLKGSEEELPPPQLPEVQKISTDIFSKFEIPSVEKYEAKQHHFQIKEQYTPLPLSTQEFSAISPILAPFEEFNLVPEPPPEIGFIPKSEVQKKKEVPDRIKRLEDSHRELSPIEIPIGAVKIFPTAQSKLTEDAHFYRVEKKEQEIISDGKPILRLQADIPIRPLSPRPSAEAVEMEKLWTMHRPTTPEIEQVRIISPITTPSQTTTLEKKWTPYKSEITEHTSSVSSSAYSAFEKTQPKPSAGVLDGKTMEKMWAHKHADSHIQKTIWPPPFEEQRLEKIPTVTEKTSRVTEDKQWHPIQTKFESSSFQEKSSSSDIITVPGPLHYVSDTTVTHISKIVDTSYSSSQRTEITKTESRNENIIEESVKPSEIIKSWPPGLPELDLRAPQMVRETVPKLDALTIRPVSVQDITDEVYLEPGPPPEIGFAEAPRERRQSYVESIEQDLEKNLEKEPSRVLPGSVRTIPPPREKSLPPPLPPKKEIYHPPPLPIKPLKPEPVEIPFEKFPDLEPFPFKPEPPKAKAAKLPPPPTPSKFIKGRFADSDYESDVEAARIPARWKPSQSDTEEPSYRKVKPPKLTTITRSRSTEPEPLPPTKFDQPPVISGPPRPSIDLEATKRELKKETITKQIKKEYKSQIHKPASPPKLKRASPPKLKPGSPPQFVHAEPPKPKPESPKAKPKFYQESGYMADTDEPLTRKVTKTEHHEIKQFSQSSETYQKSQSMFESHSSSFPHIPSKAFHKHEHKKQVSSTALKKVSS